MLAGTSLTPIKIANNVGRGEMISNLTCLIANNSNVHFYCGLFSWWVTQRNAFAFLLAALNAEDKLTRTADKSGDGVWLMRYGQEQEQRSHKYFLIMFNQRSYGRLQEQEFELKLKVELELTLELEL